MPPNRKANNFLPLKLLPDMIRVVCPVLTIFVLASTAIFALALETAPALHYEEANQGAVALPSDPAVERVIVCNKLFGGYVYNCSATKDTLFYNYCIFSDAKSLVLVAGQSVTTSIQVVESCRPPPGKAEPQYFPGRIPRMGAHPPKQG